MDAPEVDAASPSQGQVRDLAQKIAALRERQARLETHRKALQESGEAPLSLTDPDATAQLGPSQGSFSERAVPLRRGNRHLRLSERAAAEAPVHQQGA